MKTRPPSAQHSPLIKRPLRLIALLGISVFLLLAIEIGPRKFLQYGLTQWVESKTGGSLSIEKVDFNVFSGRVQLHNSLIIVNGEQQFSAKYIDISIDWKQLFKKRVLFRMLDLHGINIRANKQEASWVISGFLIRPDSGSRQTLPLADTSPGWKFGLTDIKISNSGFILKLNRQTVSISLDKANIRNVLGWKNKAPVLLDADIKILQSPATISIISHPFNETKNTDITFNVKNLNLDLVNMLQTKGEKPIMSGHLSLNSTLYSRTNSQNAILVDARHEGSIQDPGIDFTSGSLAASNLGISINTSTSLAHNSDLKSNPTGEITVSDLLYKNKVGDVNLSSSKASFDLNSIVNTQAGSTVFSINLNASSNDLMLKTATPGMPSLKSGNIEIRALHLSNSGNYSIGEVDLNNIYSQTGQMVQPLAKRVIVKEMRSETKSDILPKISIADVALSELDLSIIRTRSKTFSINGVSFPAKTGDADREQQSILEVSKLSIDNKSKINFSDYSLSPVFNASLQPIELTASGLSNAANSSGKVHLHTKLNDYTDISVSGEVSLPRLSSHSNIRGHIQTLDLPYISAYLGPAAGYQFKQGHMDASFRSSIRAGEMDSILSIMLKRSTLDTYNPEIASALTNNLSMPLDTALDLLRDKQGNIQLEIPVSGNVKDPKFDLTDIANQAAGKALKIAAMTYVKTALYPWGNLITAVTVAGKVVKMRFDPVVFEPAGVMLDHNATAYLDKIAELMKNRSTLDVNLCGALSIEDINIVMPIRSKVLAQKDYDLSGIAKITREKLFGILQKRAQSVRDYLIQEKNIAAKRLFLCRPVLEIKEVDPSVIISI